ncbi:hypothetical protein LINPERHAP1_LOCUS6971, partial [Linum perenne]
RKPTTPTTPPPIYIKLAPHPYIFSVNRLYRSSTKTNQRLYFYVDLHGRHLGTDGQDGLVHIYNLQTRRWIFGIPIIQIYSIHLRSRL